MYVPKKILKSWLRACCNGVDARRRVWTRTFVTVTCCSNRLRPHVAAAKDRPDGRLTEHRLPRVHVRWRRQRLWSAEEGARWSFAVWAWGQDAYPHPVYSGRRFRCVVGIASTVVCRWIVQGVICRWIVQRVFSQQVQKINPIVLFQWFLHYPVRLGQYF